MGRNSLDGINIFHDDSRVYFHIKGCEVWIDNKNPKWSAPDDNDELKASLLNDALAAPLELIEWTS